MPKGNNQAENTGREGRLGHFAVRRSGGAQFPEQSVFVCVICCQGRFWHELFVAQAFAR